MGIWLYVGLPGSAITNDFSITTAIVCRKKESSDAYPGICSDANRRNERVERCGSGPVVDE